MLRLSECHLMARGSFPLHCNIRGESTPKRVLYKCKCYCSSLCCRSILGISMPLSVRRYQRGIFFVSLLTPLLFMSLNPEVSAHIILPNKEGLPDPFKETCSYNSLLWKYLQGILFILCHSKSFGRWRGGEMAYSVCTEGMYCAYAYFPGLFLCTMRLCVCVCVCVCAYVQYVCNVQ